MSPKKLMLEILYDRDQGRRARRIRQLLQRRANDDNLAAEILRDGGRDNDWKVAVFDAVYPNDEMPFIWKLFNAARILMCKTWNPLQPIGKTSTDDGQGEVQPGASQDHAHGTPEQQEEEG